ncbi:hypothetical protein HMPREF1624_07369 [Sporothrix schenckii ATCC 58251]|uniref:MICOS complex subunit MIC60 n=1 Tax=Sporothrix schenckii (strain ATCC 58251 / de Perez 2211183) TaxID=1391915 RepID=U7PLM4_SPOS1|nr:hypothetical protein HMPREF1624_07369 [Sporothrix schenckii ATCC 58251]
MLRTSLRSARALGSRPSAASARTWRVVGASQRFYADAPKPPVLPASETRTAASSPVPPPPTTTSARIPSDSVPLTPPPPPPAPPAAAAAAAAAGNAAPRRKGGFFRKLRNYVLTLSLLGALAFGGGVWYSRINDNFHDFFTEYIPFGEQAVLYLEELDFRKRFPNIAERVGHKARDTGANVRVPAQSGASWRVADVETSRQSAAVPKKSGAEAAPAAAAAAAPATTAAPKKGGDAPSAPTVPAKAENPARAKDAVVESPVTNAAEAAVVANTQDAKTTTEAAAAAPAFRAPEVDEPSRWPPASPIDPLAVPDAAEPVVQDVVRLLNDIITVVNADKANGKYAATIGKAKEQVSKVGRKIQAIRAAAETDAAAQVAARTASFDAAAQDLVARVEAAMATQEAQWRAEFDEQMAAVRSSYDARLQLATARERELSEAKLQNKLAEQAVQLTQQFAGELRDRVETERSGRLGRLAELSASVAELERLTAGWTEVVDASQRAQQLHVAMDAVRARLADDEDATASHGAAQPVLRPFVKELVAVKEIATADPVVDAAIASIPPAAYQRGIATTSELIDRFRRVAGEVRKASLLPEDAGVASHASSYVLSKVLFRKQGAAANDANDAHDANNAANANVETILTRTQAFLEEGNLDGAAREMNGLKGWAKTLSRDWLGEVRKVLEVQQALDVITAEARLRSLQLEKSR